MHKIFIALAALLCLGNIEADLNALAEQGRYEEAVALAREEAATGDPIALDWLGWAYENGNGVDADADTAERYYRQAVSLGNNHARWRLGVMIDMGTADGSPEEAVALFRQAAAENYVDAIVSLAVMQATGRGTPQDYALALQNYMAAAALGEPHAVRGVSIMLWNGEGVDVDRPEAAAWALLAVAMGNEDAQETLSQMLGSLEGDGLLDEDALVARAGEIADGFGFDMEFERAPE